LKFMGYAGEEHGLLGSRHIAQTYNDQNVNVIGVLQLDMTNYHGSTDDIWLMTDYTDNAQTAFLGELIDVYLTDLTRNVTSCGYACSDHAAWFLEGFVTSMPSETRFGEHNPFLHTSNDTISVSGGRAVHAVKFVRLGLSYVAELAKGDVNGSAPTTRSQISILAMVDLMTGFGPCDSICPRDLNNDQMVNSSDLRILFDTWGRYRCLDFVQGEACQ